MAKIEVTAKCECGSEILEIDFWEEEQEFCFVQYKYHPAFYNFGRRLKFLFTGKISYNEIILSKENAQFLALSINDLIKSYGKIKE